MSQKRNKLPKQEYASMGRVAEMLGVDIITLRKYDQIKGLLNASVPREDIDEYPGLSSSDFVKDL